jgi:hypothetical protein
MEIWVKNTFRGLVPMYDTDLDNKKKLKIDQEYLVTVKMPRNIKFHRKMFALYNLVFQNQEQYRLLDDLRRDITIEAGFYRERTNINGEVIKEAESISFANMDDDVFSQLYNRSLDVIVKYFHFDKQSMIDEIEQFF